jgi:lipopolysaccharide export LptBFGC system permease protein LptF
VFQTVVTVLVIIAIFLLERVGGIVSNALESGIALTRLPKLVLLTAPEIVGLALPLALLIAMFRVFLRLREDGELVSMTNVGVRPTYFLAFAVWLGMTCTVIALFVSGWVEPLFHYGQRLEIFEAQKEAVEKGLHPDEIRSVNGYVLAKPRQSDGDSAKDVFIVDTNPKTFQRLISAERIVVSETAAREIYNVDLINLRVDFLEHALRAPALPSGKQDSLVVSKKGQRTVIGAAHYAHTLTLGELASFEPRLGREAERTLTELLAWFSPDGRTSLGFELRATGIVQQSLLCLAAALLAPLAVSLAQSASSMIVLPTIAALLFVFGIALGEIAKMVQASGFHPLVPAVMLQLAVIVMVGWITYRLMLSSAFLKPSRATV